MLKSYKFKDIRFQTITIPKGTVLFRGLNFDTTSHYLSIFNDLIGYKYDKYFTIDPRMNVFFYPVPYVSDSVKIYDIHIMYITQYDIELLLLIHPSDMTRSNKDDDFYKDILTTCINISKYDKCGQEMSKVDPCFTEDMMKQYPQIDGYIGIAKQDAELFTKKYQDMLIKYNNIDKIKQILPAILSNSREIIAVPEIVIHPFRFRHDTCHIITENFYSPSHIINYCIRNRAQYNFFPLLYFTNNNSYTLNELKSSDIIKIISNNSRIYNNKGFKIYDRINDVFSKMLGDGYKINNTIYKVLVDNRTGFYTVFTNTPSEKCNSRNTRKKIHRNFKDDSFNGYIDSYIIKHNNDPRINTIMSSHKNYINNFINDLEANGYSPKKKLVLNRGDKHNFIYKYYIDKVFERPDLDGINNIRRRKKNITNKKTSNYFSAMLKLNDFNMNDLDDISSVDTDTYHNMNTDIKKIDEIK